MAHCWIALLVRQAVQRIHISSLPRATPPCYTVQLSQKTFLVPAKVVHFCPVDCVCTSPSWSRARQLKYFRNISDSARWLTTLQRDSACTSPGQFLWGNPAVGRHSFAAHRTNRCCSRVAWARLECRVAENAIQRSLSIRTDRGRFAVAVSHKDLILWRK